jgi:hypothetical protein
MSILVSVGTNHRHGTRHYVPKVTYVNYHIPLFNPSNFNLRSWDEEIFQTIPGLIAYSCP